MKYDEQLKTKQWKEKRQLVLDRDNHTCTGCGSKYRLQVHHTKYISGRLAWEYPNSFLVTLCYDCHVIVHDTVIPIPVIKDEKKKKRKKKKPIPPPQPSKKIKKTVLTKEQLKILKKEIIVKNIIEVMPLTITNDKRVHPKRAAIKAKKIGTEEKRNDGKYKQPINKKF